MTKLFNWEVSDMSLKAIFDLDHCLYQDPKNKTELYETALIQTMAKFGVALTQAALRSIDHNMRDDHDALRMELRTYGVAFEAFFKASHDIAIALFEKNVQPNPALRDLFNKIGKDNIVILTHGSSHWAEAMLRKLGLRDVLKDDNILTLDHEHVKGRRKEQTRDPFWIAANRLGAKPQEITFFDDLVKNHVHPSEMGMKTVLVHWGNPPSEPLPHVAEMAESTEEYLQRCAL